MKYLAMHDRSGNLAALIACPPDSPPLMMTPEPGLLVTEVEGPERLMDISGPEGEKRAAEVLGQFQVTGVLEGKLVRRKSSKDER
jgi:hypothetical protein